MSKKIIIVLIASLLLSGCSYTSATTNQGTEKVVDTTEQATTNVATEAAQETESKSVEDGLLGGGKYKVELKEARKTRSKYENADVLEVTYVFTNNSDEAASADMALYFKAYQDGIEMDPVFDVELTGENHSKNIKPGVSLECKALFKLTSNSDVEVEVVEAFSFSNNKVVKVYTLE
jgi:uncharacterized protein YceK